eukprot:747204_1
MIMNIWILLLILIYLFMYGHLYMAVKEEVELDMIVKYVIQTAYMIVLKKDIVTYYLSGKKEIERFQQCIANNKTFIVPNCNNVFFTKGRRYPTGDIILHGTDLELPLV